MSKKFIEMVAEYPATCTYPEYEGKPYFSIRYEENGELIEGFGTYKPEVLSEYIREYFIGADVVERKKGKWRVYEGEITCSCCETTYYTDMCEYIDGNVPKFCPNCGAAMTREEDDVH